MKLKLSQYKILTKPKYPYNLKKINSSFSLNEKGELLESYISPDIGILLKNTVTSKSEILHIDKYLEYLDYKYLKSHYILYKSLYDYFFIKYLDKNTQEYTIKVLLHETDQYFLVDNLDKMFLIYLDGSTRKINIMSSEDNFSETFTLDDVYLKENLSTVYKDVNDNIVLVFHIEDLSIISNLNKIPIQERVMEVEYKVDMSLLKEVVK